MKKLLLFCCFLFSIFSYCQNSDEVKKRQDAIIEEHLTNCALKYSYNSRMSDWQECIDAGLKKDSTIAYLWQQKAMPYFKARKYELGMSFLDKAVQYDATRWQPYRAFIKCIFSKTYRDAIIDFENCKQKYGNQYVMDHTYDFYIALCYLQLNEFNKAEKLLENYTNEALKLKGEEMVHHTALFYLGIALYEQKRWNEAITTFDRALIKYANYSDVKYYKAICLLRLEKTEDAKKLFVEAKKDFEIGYKINEDNVIYETYPYQVRW